ncbi:MAG: DUF177 domain-containing protein [Succinivibrio sp.]|nr:DUF177 domain-containing protein [Succinivibrio sp.]
MTTSILERFVNFTRASDLQSHYVVNLERAQLPRLSEAVDDVREIRADFRFFHDLQGLRTIKGEASCQVSLSCQRCGEPLSLTLKSTFCSTPDAQKARSLRLGDKLDLVETDEEGQFDVLQYLEDCLLLELPYAPVHEEGQCARAGEFWSYGELDEKAAQSPFAVLGELELGKDGE